MKYVSVTFSGDFASLDNAASTQALFDSVTGNPVVLGFWHLLAMVGLYGVLSFSAARRTKEIGIRFALGASRWAAQGLIFREALVLAVAGLAMAMPVSWLLGRFVEHQLFGVRSTDPFTLAVSGAILVLVCLVASAIAARKASSVSPLDALRSE